MPLDQEFRNVTRHAGFVYKFAANIDIDDYHNPPIYEAYAPSLHGTELIGFKIYYGDETVLTSADGRWRDLPTGASDETPDKLGVQAIRLYENYNDPDGITPLVLTSMGNNYYYRAERAGEAVYGAITETEGMDLPQFAPIKDSNMIKYGRWIDNVVWRRIFQFVNNDYDVNVFDYLR